MGFIVKEIDIDICEFLFADGRHLHVAFNDKNIKIITTRFSASNIKYWLSHIHFSKMKNKLGERLLEEGRSTVREIVHSNEEKEYMPAIIRGTIKNSCPLVRKLKVSPEGRFRRQGEL